MSCVLIPYNEVLSKLNGLANNQYNIVTMVTLVSYLTLLDQVLAFSLIVSQYAPLLSW